MTEREALLYALHLCDDRSVALLFRTDPPDIKEAAKAAQAGAALVATIQRLDRELPKQKAPAKPVQPLPPAGACF